MSNVKGNDIDDLFKRASEKYPLRTDSADWDKLAAALEKDPSFIVPPPNAEGDKRRRRRFFWLFILLPLGGLMYYISIGHNHQGITASTKKVSSQQTPAQQGAANPVQQGTANPVQPGATAQAPATTRTTSGPSASVGKEAASTSAGPAKQVSTREGITPAKQGIANPGQQGTANTAQQGPANPGQQKVTPKEPGAPVKTATGQLSPAPTVSSASTTSPASTGIASRTPVETITTTTGRDISGGQNHITAGNVHKNTPLSDKHDSRHVKNEPATTGEAVTGTAQERLTGNHLAVSQPPAAERVPSFSILNYQRAPTSGRGALDVTVKANNTVVSIKDSSKNKKTKNNHQRYLYAGLLVAPDLSTVKFQSVKGTGTTFGVLLGYQLSGEWAIETGAYYDHKKYYTDGEYFKGNYNPAYKLLNVDGACNMWEIPVNVRYNLHSGEKTKWFATTGLSTYLMTKENYVSTYMYNGNTWDYAWGQKKSSQYWFSIVNLSIGYEQKLGKIGNLRLEPYLRIPLRGMGSGSLPIMSAGLNVGITRRIW